MTIIDFEGSEKTAIIIITRDSDADVYSWLVNVMLVEAHPH